MTPVRYSLHYETYSDHLMSSFGKLLQTQLLVDMTLMCSSHTIRVHKAVLSASSIYFQEILQKQLGEPLIILKMKFGVLKCLVEFMYCGKTQCLEENMDELVAAAQFLKIKGLSKVTRESLGISSTAELPVFTPPVVINRPSQNIIDLHAKDTIVRIPFDIESGGNSNNYTSPAQYVKPKRGRPSLRRSASYTAWDSNNDSGRAQPSRGQDSRNALHQLKNLHTQNMQDYMDRLTLSHAVDSSSNLEDSKKNFINIDNDLIYMNQTMPSDILDKNISYTKGVLSNEKITAGCSTSSTRNDSSNGDNVNKAMSQYVNALKNAGLPTDLPILFESGDGSYINVNEQVLLDMVQSSEIQYEVIEQPNLMENVPDLNGIKSIDDLSKSIERGESLMDPKTLHETSDFSKESGRETLNSLNEILPDNLDTFNDQTNYVSLESNLSNFNAIQNETPNDLSCIENDLHFFTKSMSEDVKKYYVDSHLKYDSGEMEQYCPVSTTLDTSFNMALLDTKNINLSDPMNDNYHSDLSRNDDCFNIEQQLPNPHDFKDETLDYLISTPKRNNSDKNYDDEKQVYERNEIIKDLMNIEMNINNKNTADAALNINPDEQYDISNEIIRIEGNDNHDVQSSVYLPKETQHNLEETTTNTLSQTETKTYQDSYEASIKAQGLDKTNTICQEVGKSDSKSEEDNIMEVTSNENIPLAVGLQPLQKIPTQEDSLGCSKRKSFNSDYMHDIDVQFLKRKMKYKKK